MFSNSISHCTRFLLLLSIFLIFSNPLTAKKSDVPKNIIIMIGDGMGLGAISAYYLANTNANLSKFKKIGLMSTYAEGSLVTDSAASGTALSTGYKTKNGHIATLPDGKIVPTVMEVAKKKGKVTGIIVTCSITHATPATFYAHVSSRLNETEIATFVTNQTIDLFIGGGLSFFLPTTTTIPSQSTYSEETNQQPTATSNLVDILLKLGYNIITNYEDLKNYNPAKFEKILALLEPIHLPPILSGNRKTTLAEMTKKSLDLLSKNKEGFILMVEGSQIDWEAHANNHKGLIEEMRDFDNAVGIAIDFVLKNPDTLLIVTSDHETGGVSIIGGVLNKLSTIRFASKDHTAELVPIFSIGLGSDNFIGFIDNTFVGKKLIEFLQN
ncbi:MAG: alkaline phosphatase [Brevinematales bacterium]|nr:alkaline phosphatase [Brevinematales bacterium]